MTTALTIAQLHDRLIPLPAGTLAILDTPAWPIPALRRDFDGERAVSLEATIWQPDADGDPSGYSSEFGPIFTEHPDPVTYGLVRDGDTLTRGEIHANDDDFGWRQVHRDVVAGAQPGDVVYFGYPGTRYADLTVMLAIEGGRWVVTGCAYGPLDQDDEDDLPEVTAINSTLLLQLDWHGNRTTSATAAAQ